MRYCALSCVIGWFSFWTFGAIAVFVPTLNDLQIIVAAILAFGGIMAGMTSYLKLCRECR
jgi:hypothetical protein